MSFPRLKAISATALRSSLASGRPPLILDARRAEALRRKPVGLPSAVPVLLDDAELRIPEISRTHPIVVYCLCSGQASSTRVALRLSDAGYEDVSVLDGGLPAWEAAGFPMQPIAQQQEAADDVRIAVRPLPAAAADPHQLIAERSFLAGQSLPARRDLAVLFVDMVDSTSLVFSRSPEEVLALVQAFMKEVVQVAVTHCGDVHDFEGDGAMLYFAGVGEALPAAFNIRAALARRRRELPDLPRLRMALDAGPLVVGYVGTQERRALSFIGPVINTAARILKLAPADGIVATQRVVDSARFSDPDLAVRFEALPERQSLKGIAEPVSVFVEKGDDHCHECHGGR